MIGDIVNTANRLEHLTKRVDASLLVHKTTSMKMGDDFVIKKTAVKNIRGKKNAIEIYQVLKSKEEASSKEEIVFF